MQHRLAPPIEQKDMSQSTLLKWANKALLEDMYDTQPHTILIERDKYESTKLTMRWLCGVVQVTMHDDGFVEVGYSHMNIDKNGQEFPVEMVRTVIRVTESAYIEFEEQMHTRFP